MFCNHWKNMPLYTKGIVLKVINILEWGILIHIGFGMMMLTNPNIFKYEPTLFNTITPLVSTRSANFLKGVVMIERERFSNPHSSLYLLGVMAITALFIFNKITALCIPSGIGLFEAFINLCMKCCVKDNQDPP
jgi:hypothetical protein